jgi:sugar phosphate isomerase/epimerase
MVCPLDKIAIVEKLGYDYMESTIVPVATMTDKEYEMAKEMVLSHKIKVEAFNAIFPGDMKLTGPTVDTGTIRSYLVKAMARLAGLGCKTVVFGSGKSRTYPEGWDKVDAIRQMERSVILAADIGARNGILIVIEPLNSKESNIVTTVTEGCEMAMRLNHPNVKLLADFYHMRLDGENLDSIVPCAPILRHTHIANKFERRFPLERSEDLYDEFFDALAKADYHLGISVEGNPKDFEKDAAGSLKLLRELAADHKV